MKKSNLSKMNNNHQYDHQLGLNPSNRSKPIKLVRNHLNNFKNHQLVQNHRHGQTDYSSIITIDPDQFDWFWSVVWVETLLFVILVAFLIFRNFEGLWPNSLTFWKKNRIYQKWKTITSMTNNLAWTQNTDQNRSNWSATI